MKEWRRGSRLLCIYCKGKYATLGCVGKQCKYDYVWPLSATSYNLFLFRKAYHLPCGLEHGSLQQFYGNYESYCETHRPVQDPFLPKNKNKVEMFQKNDECGCCTMELEVRFILPEFTISHGFGAGPRQRGEGAGALDPLL